MMSASQKEYIFIPGPAGRIEAELNLHNDFTKKYIAIICHPHPLHGGTMNNKVVTTMARLFRDFNIITIRFNYRGVGHSEGTYGESIGETEDALAVIQWAQSKWPDHDIILAGFSFGAYISLKAAIQIKPTLLISIAPAVNHVYFANVHPHCPWIVAIAENDEIVPAQDIYRWIDTLDPKPHVLSFPDTNHFFDGKLTDLRDKLAHAYSF